MHDMIQQNRLDGLLHLIYDAVELGTEELLNSENEEGVRGDTPLHTAVKMAASNVPEGLLRRLLVHVGLLDSQIEASDLVKALLVFGADTTKENESGKTAGQLAKDMWDEDETNLRMQKVLEALNGVGAVQEDGGDHSQVAFSRATGRN